MKWSVKCPVVFDSFVTPWTAALQAPLSMAFSRQEYWSGLPFPSPGNLPNLGIKPLSLVSCTDRQVLYHLCHLGSPVWLGLIQSGLQSRKLGFLEQINSASRLWHRTLAWFSSLPAYLTDFILKTTMSVLNSYLSFQDTCLLTNFCVNSPHNHESKFLKISLSFSISLSLFASPSVSLSTYM